MRLLFFILFISVFVFCRQGLAQNPELIRPYPIGDYIDFENNSLRIARPDQETDSAYIEVLYNKKNYLFESVSDSLFQNDSANLRILFFTDSLVINDVVYYRLTGRNEFNRVVIKNKFKKTENKLCLVKKKVFLMRGIYTVTHFDNNVKNGKYISRRLFFTRVRGHYKNDLKEGKWVYKYRIWRNGKRWYEKGKVIKEKNIDHRRFS